MDTAIASSRPTDNAVGSWSRADLAAGVTGDGMAATTWSGHRTRTEEPYASGLATGRAKARRWGPATTVRVAALLVASVAIFASRDTTTCFGADRPDGAQLTVTQLEGLRTRFFGADATPLKRRDDFARLMAELPQIAGVAVRGGSLGGVSGLWVSPDKSPTGHRTILYLHGGGFYSGSSSTHRNLAATLALDADAELFVPDYRLAPESAFPAEIDDVELSYRALLAQGREACSIALAGESAGGTLVVSLTERLKASGAQLPGSLFIMSPLLDFGAASRSMVDNRDRDHVIAAAGVHAIAAMLFGTETRRPPESEPLVSDFRGFPPTLIQVGADEVLLDDAISLARVEAVAGVDISFHVFPGVVHQWQAFPGVFPQARTALQEGAAHISSHGCRGGGSALQDGH